MSSPEAPVLSAPTHLAGSYWPASMTLSCSVNATAVDYQQTGLLALTVEALSQWAVNDAYHHNLVLLQGIAAIDDTLLMLMSSTAPNTFICIYLRQTSAMPDLMCLDNF
jgi:hypothetical protein